MNFIDLVNHLSGKSNQHLDEAGKGFKTVDVTTARGMFKNGRSVFISEHKKLTPVTDHFQMDEAITRKVTFVAPVNEEMTRYKGMKVFSGFWVGEDMKGQRYDTLKDAQQAIDDFIGEGKVNEGKFDKYTLIKMGKNGESAEIYTEIDQVLLYDRTGSLVGEGKWQGSVDATVEFYRQQGFKVNSNISHKNESDAGTGWGKPSTEKTIKVGEDTYTIQVRYRDHAVNHRTELLKNGKLIKSENADHYESIVKKFTEYVEGLKSGVKESLDGTDINYISRMLQKGESPNTILDNFMIDAHRDGEKLDVAAVKAEIEKQMKMASSKNEAVAVANMTDPKQRSLVQYLYNSYGASPAHLLVTIEGDIATGKITDTAAIDAATEFGAKAWESKVNEAQDCQMCQIAKCGPKCGCGCHNATESKVNEDTVTADQFANVEEALEFLIDDRSHGDDYMAYAAQEAYDSLFSRESLTPQESRSRLPEYIELVNKLYAEAQVDAEASRNNNKDPFESKVNETGEMGQHDVEPGGEWHETALQMLEDAKTIAMTCKGKFTYGKVSPFDQYQGPYIQTNFGRMWNMMGDSPVRTYFLDRPRWVGTPEELAAAISGDEDMQIAVAKAAQEESGEEPEINADQFPDVAQDADESKGNRTTGAQRYNARMDKIWANAKASGALSDENLAKAREWEEEMRKKKQAKNESKITERKKQALLAKFQAAFPKVWAKPGEDFNGSENAVIWSGEGSEVDGVEAFDYYDEDPNETLRIMGVHKKLVAWADANGLYWECNDPGTWIAFPSEGGPLNEAEDDEDAGEIEVEMGAVNVGGTALVGYIDASYQDLVDVFGEPQFRGQGDKVTCEWNGTINGSVFTIYDWKSDVPAEEVTHWNVGGKVNRVAELQEYIKSKKSGVDVAQEEDDAMRMKSQPEENVEEGHDPHGKDKHCSSCKCDKESKDTTKDPEAEDKHCGTCACESVSKSTLQGLKKYLVKAGMYGAMDDFDAYVNSPKAKTASKEQIARALSFGNGGVMDDILKALGALDEAFLVKAKYPNGDTNDNVCKTKEEAEEWKKKFEDDGASEVTIVNEDRGDQQFNQAVAKWKEAVAYAKKINMGKDGELIDGDLFDDLIVKKFGGTTEQTGGHVMVNYIPVVGPYYLSITQEVVVLNKAVSGKTMTNSEEMLDDAFEAGGENDIKVAYIYEPDMSESIGKYMKQFGNKSQVKEAEAKRCKNCNNRLDGYSKRCDHCQACVDTEGKKCACGEGPTPDLDEKVHKADDFSDSDIVIYDEAEYWVDAIDDTDDTVHITPFEYRVGDGEWVKASELQFHPNQSLKKHIRRIGPSESLLDCTKKVRLTEGKKEDEAAESSRQIFKSVLRKIHKAKGEEDIEVALDRLMKHYVANDANLDVVKMIQGEAERKRARLAKGDTSDMPSGEKEDMIDQQVEETAEPVEEEMSPVVEPAMPGVDPEPVDYQEPAKPDLDDVQEVEKKILVGSRVRLADGEEAIVAEIQNGQYKLLTLPDRKIMKNGENDMFDRDQLEEIILEAKGQLVDKLKPADVMKAAQKLASIAVPGERIRLTQIMQQLVRDGKIGHNDDIQTVSSKIRSALAMKGWNVGPMGESKVNEDVPTEKEFDIPKEVMDEQELSEDPVVADYLSDVYGWCVVSLEVRKNPDGSGVAFNVVWDEECDGPDFPDDRPDDVVDGGDNITGHQNTGMPESVEKCEGCGGKLASKFSKDAGLCYKCLNKAKAKKVEEAKLTEGYTHYWYMDEGVPIDDETWAKAKAAASDIIKQAEAKGIRLAGPNGSSGKPEVSDEVIAFNGYGEESHESFFIDRQSPKDFSFCKTAYKPYDGVVVSIVSALNKLGIFKSVSSDGGDEVFENPEFVPNTELDFRQEIEKAATPDEKSWPDVAAEVDEASNRKCDYMGKSGSISCGAGKAQKRLHIKYNREDSDTLHLCNDCASKVQADAKRYDYDVSVTNESEQTIKCPSCDYILPNTYAVDIQTRGTMKCPGCKGSLSVNDILGDLKEASAPKPHGVGELITSGSNSGEDFEWEDLTSELTYAMKKVNPTLRWTAQVKGFGWRGVDGSMPAFEAKTGQELLSKILPNTECSMKIYYFGKNGIAIDNAHHDKPMGGEWYYIVPATVDMEEHVNEDQWSILNTKTKSTHDAYTSKDEAKKALEVLKKEKGDHYKLVLDFKESRINEVMNMMPKEIATKIPKLRSMDGKDKHEVPIAVKFFDPTGSWTWYATEGEPTGEIIQDGAFKGQQDWEFFGYVKGFEGELGYWTLGELSTAKQGVTGLRALPIERDRHFSGKTLADVMGHENESVNEVTKTSKIHQQIKAECEDLIGSDILDEESAGGLISAIRKNDLVAMADEAKELFDNGILDDWSAPELLALLKKTGYAYIKDSVNEKLTEKGLETVKTWIAKFGARKAGQKMVDHFISKVIGLTSSDLADSPTFMNGLDEIEQSLTAGDFQAASDQARMTAEEMIQEEGLEGMPMGMGESKKVKESYDASTTIKSFDGPVYTISVDAGSYNPGNQPEFGKDWEYYTAEVYKQVPGKNFSDQVLRVECNGKADALKKFEELKAKYGSLKEAVNEDMPYTQGHLGSSIVQAQALVAIEEFTGKKIDPVEQEMLVFQNPEVNSNKFHYFVLACDGKPSGDKWFAANAYGRIGNRPQVIVFARGLKYDVMDAYNKKIRSKRQKGYERVEESVNELAGKKKVLPKKLDWDTVMKVANKMYDDDSVEEIRASAVMAQLVKMGYPEDAFNTRKVISALTNAGWDFKEDIGEDSNIDDRFEVRVSRDNSEAIIGLSKEDSRWIEHIIDDPDDICHGRTSNYMSYLKPRDIVKWLSNDFDRAEIVREDEDDDMDEAKVKEDWREKHSVGCYFCGKEFDERDGANADPYNNNDGGSICPECMSKKESNVILDEARTIGKRNIEVVKAIVRKHLQDKDIPASEITDVIMDELPSEMFDLWEGAYDEVQRIAMDMVMNFTHRGVLERLFNKFLGK